MSVYFVLYFEINSKLNTIRAILDHVGTNMLKPLKNWGQFDYIFTSYNRRVYSRHRTCCRWLCENERLSAILSIYELFVMYLFV